MGYDPFELPNRLTGSVCRGPMEPEYAMAEINLFGEVAVLKTINRFIDEARKRGDDIAARHISDFIRSDERTHVRKGQSILKVMTDLKHAGPRAQDARALHRVPRRPRRGRCRYGRADTHADPEARGHRAPHRRVGQKVRQRI